MQRENQIILISLIALLLRWCVTYHSYSGEGKPPLFGDYEAQRHWQEITFHLPVEKWYINGTDNDLQYWGLDYPPLSAYHSFALGYVANQINPSYVSLHKSRGFTSEKHKHFMRLTVLLADSLIYFPAVIYFMLTHHEQKAITKETNLFGFNRYDTIILIMLIYPGLILIDHAHFQYNCISLGLFIAAVARILQNSFISGSILFVAALNYKQMELYHALPLLFYILGKYSPMKKGSLLHNLGMLFCIAFTVISTFFIIWYPFTKNLEIFRNVVFRLIPISRGVFEDKVANIWCAINVIYKLRASFTNIQLAKICLITTMAAVAPSCNHLYSKPEKKSFIISLINCSLAFFLFSFQVHEKSILLVAIPVLLHFNNDPFPCFWFLIISHFSMLPLFIKDNLYSAYWATLIYFIFGIPWIFPDAFSYEEITASETAKHDTRKRNKPKQLKGNKNIPFLARLKKSLLYYQNYYNSFIDHGNWLLILFYSSITGVMLLSIVSGFLKPPNKYPDLFSLLVSIYSCGHFIVFYIYFNYKQLSVQTNS